MYYKNQEGKVYYYEEGQPVKEGLIELTQAEIDAIKNPVMSLQEKREAATLTPMQFMLNVDAAGMMPAIEAYLAEPTTPNSFKIMWSRASSFERLYPDLVAAATERGITDAQMDAIFGIA